MVKQADTNISKEYMTKNPRGRISHRGSSVEIYNSAAVSKKRKIYCNLIFYKGSSCNLRV